MPTSSVRLLMRASTVLVAALDWVHRESGRGMVAILTWKIAFLRRRME